MHSDPTDLIHRAQQGDRAAFEALYRAHAGRVYALCLRLTADAAQAEERTQDAFVRAWQRLATFRGESAFSSWLYRLTVNEVLLGRRAERRREQRIVTTDDPAALAQLRSLVGAAAALPKTIEPSRDLWGAIARRLGKRERGNGKRFWRDRAFSRRALATAAVLAIAVGTYRLLPPFAAHYRPAG